MQRFIRSIVIFSLGLMAIGGTALAQDWPNLDGNPARNGYAPNVVGPDSPNPLWSNTDDYSIITWHPFVYQGRVYAVREAAFPQAGGEAGDAVVCYDLATGDEEWRFTPPFSGDTDNEWIAWIAGLSSGQLYVCRSANNKLQPLRAYDAVTGDPLWVSEYWGDAFAYDGVVFAADGDPILGDQDYIVRISAEDGTTVWQTERNCSVSGNCGGAAAIGNGALYIDEVAGGGQIVTKIDIETGLKLYSSPVMPGFLTQTSPYVSPDGGTVYFARTQNYPETDFIYAFADTGAALVERWHSPIGLGDPHGVGPDGTVYVRTADDEFVGLSPETGEVMYSAGVLSPLRTSLETAIDAEGKVYLSNHWANTPATDGRLWVFSPDLQTLYFTLNLDRNNQGGPALAGSNILLMADRTGIYAYQNPAIDGDVDGDGDVDLSDLAALLAAYGACDGDPNYVPAADVDDSGCVDLSDLAALLANYGTGL